jgi:hypothetical protein
MTVSAIDAGRVLTDWPAMVSGVTNASDAASEGTNAMRVEVVM